MKTVGDIIAERDTLRRSLYALTKGCQRIEWAARVCGEANLRDPRAALLHMRREVFLGGYEGLPLSPIEETMATKQTNSIVILFAYKAIQEAIGKELSRMSRERADARSVHGRAVR